MVGCPKIVVVAVADDPCTSSKFTFELTGTPTGVPAKDAGALQVEGRVPLGRQIEKPNSVVHEMHVGCCGIDGLCEHQSGPFLDRATKVKAVGLAKRPKSGSASLTNMSLGRLRTKPIEPLSSCSRRKITVRSNVVSCIPGEARSRAPLVNMSPVFTHGSAQRVIGRSVCVSVRLSAAD